MNYQTTISGTLNTGKNLVQETFKSVENPCAVTYLFGFDGQEKDDEITGVTGSHYTAQFWEYDSRIGRRWNLDPKTTVGISEYACFAGNPIWFSDLNGDKWDPSNNSQDKADKFRGSTNKKISAVNTEITSIKNKMSGLDASSSEYADLNNQLTNTKARLGELNSTITELDALEKSDQVYQLKPTWQDPNSTTYTTSGGKFMEAGLGGKTYYKNGVVVMEYGLGDLNTQAHELKHGFQFETGLVSFNKETGKGGWLYDLTDEQDSWKRGSAFSNKLTSPLLNVTTSDLIKMEYCGISMSLNSSMKVYDIFHTWGNAPSKYENLLDKTFKESEIDITR